MPQTILREVYIFGAFVSGLVKRQGKKIVVEGIVIVIVIMIVIVIVLLSGGGGKQSLEWKPCRCFCMVILTLCIHKYNVIDEIV